MFVIMQCFSNLSDQQKSTLPLPEQIGQAMRHAGVAISITSLTDITHRFHEIHRHVQAGQVTDGQRMLPVEHGYPIPTRISEVIGSAHSDD